jgi:hypothetical protein
MSNVNQRGRGRPGQMTREQLQAALAALDNGPVAGPSNDGLVYTCLTCSRDFVSQNSLTQHNASLHGGVITRKDGTPASVRDSVADRARTSQQARQPQQQQQQQQTRRPAASQANNQFVLSAPLWVQSASQQNIRQDVSLPTRAALQNGRELFLVNRNPFTIGNGQGNRLNLRTMITWSQASLNGDVPNVPYPMSEFIGLEIAVHGSFGSHGDFALVYLTVANGASGITANNTPTGTPSTSPARTSLLALRWAMNMTSHTVITGPGCFFIPAAGPGSSIQGAGHLNIVSGTSVLAADATLVTVTMAAVFAVSGDRQ